MIDNFKAYEFKKIIRTKIMFRSLFDILLYQDWSFNISKLMRLAFWTERLYRNEIERYS